MFSYLQNQCTYLIPYANEHLKIQPNMHLIMMIELISLSSLSIPSKCLCYCTFTDQRH